MTFVPYANRRSRPWREFLTADETAQLEALDAEKVELDKRRREISRDRLLITNRATQRAGLSKGKAA